MNHAKHRILVVLLTAFLSFIIAPFFSLFAQSTGTQVGQSFFSRNLRIGDQGADVKILQRILNDSLETRLIATGPGAPGEETTYFGELTKSAVARFQEKYAAEILTPINLTQGTGFVGPMTRKKLNQAALSAGITVENTLSGVVTGESVRGGGSSQSSSIRTIGNPPKIFSISPTTIINGATMTITGEGFTPTGNQIRTTYLTLDNIPSSDGKTITFKFYAEQINSLMGLDALKLDGTTPEELIADINASKQAHPESALPSNISFLAPAYLSVANKNGASNGFKFTIDMDVTHNLATSTVSMATPGKFPLFKKVSDAVVGLTVAKIAEARSRGPSYYDIVKKATIAYWTTQVLGRIAGGAVGAAEPAFGGNIIFSLPCLCSVSTAFIVLPKAGSPGPFNATWPTTEIKENYAIFPGNHVLGSHLPAGQCSIATPVGCFNFDAKEINPLIGVGTSLTPF